MSYPNPYAGSGQCTDGLIRLINDLARHGNLHDALHWATNWRNFGERITSTPTVGVGVCFQPGKDGAAWPTGHVAKVISVSSNKRTFVIKEMHGTAGLGNYDNRTCAMVPGIEFLIPHSTPTPPPAPAPTTHFERFYVRIMSRCTAGATVRNHPTPSAGSIKVLAAGTSVACISWTHGTAIKDLETGRADRRWYELASGGWVASALVDGNAPGSQP